MKKPEFVMEEIRDYINRSPITSEEERILKDAIDVIEGLNALRLDECGSSVRPTEKPGKIGMHYEICMSLNNVYETKNHDYGDSFARIRKRYPQAIMIRLWDKLLRLETLLFGEQAMVNESIDDTLGDLANYAIMEMVERWEDRRGEGKNYE